MELVSDVFEESLISSKDSWFDLEKTTFQTLKEKQKQVFCYASHYLYKNNKILTEEFLLSKGVFIDAKAA